MKIAQVAPLADVVPPRGYGGVERVVAHLSDALVECGHDVTLFAAGGSATAAEVVAGRPISLRSDISSRRHDIAAHLNMLEDVRARSNEYDVIHFHTDVLHLPMFATCDVPVVTTIHTQARDNDARGAYRRWRAHPLVSLSRAQQLVMPECNWLGSVHNGIPTNLYAPGLEPKGYLAFVGRFNPDKGADIAISAAKALGMPLYIAARIDANCMTYFNEVISPELEHPLINFVGELGDVEKQELLEGADALLFPIRWPEPFGLVMIEAMACGTPVAALNLGSVSEVVQEGVSGAIADRPDHFLEAVRRAMILDRGRVRDHFERNFSATRMAESYTNVYEKILSFQLRHR